jgi:hypothetical protein
MFRGFRQLNQKRAGAGFLSAANMMSARRRVSAHLHESFVAAARRQIKAPARTIPKTAQLKFKSVENAPPDWQSPGFWIRLTP